MSKNTIFLQIQALFPFYQKRKGEFIPILCPKSVAGKRWVFMRQLFVRFTRSAIYFYESDPYNGTIVSRFQLSTGQVRLQKLITDTKREVLTDKDAIDAHLSVIEASLHSLSQK